MQRAARRCQVWRVNHTPSPWATCLEGDDIQCLATASSSFERHLHGDSKSSLTFLIPCLQKLEDSMILARPSDFVALLLQFISLMATFCAQRGLDWKSRGGRDSLARSLKVCLSVSLSLSLSDSLSLSLSCLSLSLLSLSLLPLSFSLVSLSLSLSCHPLLFCLCVSLSLSVYLCLSVSACVSLSLCLPVSLRVPLSLCLSLSLSVSVSQNASTPFAILVSHPGAHLYGMFWLEWQAES